MGRALAGMRRRSAVALVAIGATMGVGLLARTGRADEAPAAPGAALEQKLKDALATNEALKERIKKLEEMLQRDVCADPAAAEALLNAKVPTPAP